MILKAQVNDLQEILQLQYLAYQSEANLFGNRDIPPLKQTIDEVVDEWSSGVILKMVDDKNTIVGSVRAQERDGKEHIESEIVRERDHKKNKICRDHGFEIIRVENSYARRYNFIKSVLIDYFGKRSR